MRSLLSLCLLLLSLCCCITPTLAHVRLLYTGFPIRNALASRVDGTYSVAGPCGGVSTYGKNGITNVTESQPLSLKVAYNGGHQDPANAFRVAIYCDGTGKLTTGSFFDDSVMKSIVATKLSDGSYSVPAADSSTAGYTLSFNMLNLLAGKTSQNCVISLLDQRNWGGCVDVSLVKAGSGEAAGSVGVNAKSLCTRYCDLMGLTCTGGNAQFTQAPYTDCMTTCANYTVSPVSPYYDDFGDNVQCRINHVQYAAAQDAPSTHCPHAGPVSPNNCRDEPGVVRAPSPCYRYCEAVFSNCAGNNYFADKPTCMRTCASFLTEGRGVSATPAQGNNVFCRRDAAEAGICDSANPTAAGNCAVDNPLKINADTLSAVYPYSYGCDTPQQAANNTVTGCCCYKGNITVTHIKGVLWATVTTNLIQQFGDMCAAGTVTEGSHHYTFDSALSAVFANTFYLKQVDPAYADLQGTTTIGSDPFSVQLTADAGLLLLTNNQTSTTTPRVCSVSAKMDAASKIDTSTWPQPADPNNPPDSGFAFANAQMSVFTLFAAALIALLATRL